MFDQWDHTLQTGDDTEYTFVVLALCAGVAYSLKWVIPELARPNFRAKVQTDRGSDLFSTSLNCWASSVLISASPPSVSLRI